MEDLQQACDNPVVTIQPLPPGPNASTTPRAERVLCGATAASFIGYANSRFVLLAQRAGA